MKHFIYTFKEGKSPRNGSGITYTTAIYSIKRNQVELVGSISDTYVSEFQLVMMAMEKFKVLPKAAFERHANGGLRYGNAWHLKEDGIAAITRV